MSLESSHLSQYRRNRDTLDRIYQMDKPPYDWVVTIAFYTAVHLIEMFIVQKNNKPSSNHDDRMSWVSKISELKPIRKYYGSLSQSSWQARYKCITFKESHAKKIMEQLEQIEDELKRHI